MVQEIEEFKAIRFSLFLACLEYNCCLINLVNSSALDLPAFTASISVYSMKSLADFPPEILRLIFSESSHSALVIQLIKTGDRLLIHKLSNGVESIHLRHKADTSSNLPKSLVLFSNLRHFCLTRSSSWSDERYDNLAVYSDVLASSKLETLEINGFIFLPNDPPFNSSKSQLKSSTSLATLSFFPFQALTTLLGEFGSWSASHYQSLPPTLTRLGNFVEHCHSRSEAIMASLPRGLIEWNVSIEMHDSSEVSDIPRFWCDPPPALRKIDQVGFEEATIGSYFASYLPKSLTHFAFRLKSLNRDPFGMVKIFRIPNPQLFVSQLPEGIRDFDIGKVRMSSIEIGAGGWEKVSKMILEDDFQRNPKPINDDRVPRVICALPSSLTRLTLSTYPDDLATLQPLDWPSGLTDLNLTNSVPNLDILKSLPPSLTVLRFFIGSKHDIEELHWGFPPSLRHLYMNVFGGLRSIKMAKALPDTLEAWTLNYHTMDESPLQFHITAFPPALKRLDANATSAIDFLSLNNEPLPLPTL